MPFSTIKVKLFGDSGVGKTRMVRKLAPPSLVRKLTDRIWPGSATHQNGGGSGSGSGANGGDHLAPTRRNSALLMADPMHGGGGGSSDGGSSSRLENEAADRHVARAFDVAHPGYTRGVEITQIKLADSPTAGQASYVDVWEFSGHKPYRQVYDYLVGDTKCVHVVVYRLIGDTGPIAATVQFDQIRRWADFITARLAGTDRFGSAGHLLLKTDLVIIGLYSSTDPLMTARRRSSAAHGFDANGYTFTPNSGATLAVPGSQTATSTTTNLEQTLLQSAQETMQLVGKHFGHIFNICNNRFIIDLASNSTVAQQQLKALKVHLAALKQQITSNLAEPLMCLNHAADKLAAYNNDHRPVMRWDEFLCWVRNDINPLATVAVCRELATQLQIIGKLVYLQTETPQMDSGLFVTDTKWLGQAVIGRTLSHHSLAACRISGSVTSDDPVLIAAAQPRAAETATLLQCLRLLGAATKVIGEDSYTEHEIPSYVLLEPPKSNEKKDDPTKRKEVKLSPSSLKKREQKRLRRLSNMPESSARSSFAPVGLICPKVGLIEPRDPSIFKTGYRVYATDGALFDIMPKVQCKLRQLLNLHAIGALQHSSSASKPLNRQSNHQSPNDGTNTSSPSTNAFSTDHSSHGTLARNGLASREPLPDGGEEDGSHLCWDLVHYSRQSVLRVSDCIAVVSCGANDGRDGLPSYRGSMVAASDFSVSFSTGAERRCSSSSASAGESNFARSMNVNARAWPPLEIIVLVTNEADKALAYWLLTKLVHLVRDVLCSATPGLLYIESVLLSEHSPLLRDATAPRGGQNRPDVDIADNKSGSSDDDGVDSDLRPEFEEWDLVKLFDFARLQCPMPGVNSPRGTANTNARNADTVSLYSSHTETHGQYPQDVVSLLADLFLAPSKECLRYGRHIIPGWEVPVMSLPPNVLRILAAFLDEPDNLGKDWATLALRLNCDIDLPPATPQANVANNSANSGDTSSIITKKSMPSTAISPTIRLLGTWERDVGPANATLLHLLNALVALDRNDCVDLLTRFCRVVHLGRCNCVTAANANANGGGSVSNAQGASTSLPAEASSTAAPTSHLSGAGSDGIGNFTAIPCDAFHRDIVGDDLASLTREFINDDLYS